MASKSLKTFKYVGVSLFNGKIKARYTNDIASRMKVMLRGGHANIQFTELPRAMTKEEIESEGFHSKALASYKAETAAKDPATKSVKVPKPTKTKEVPATQLLNELGVETVA